MNIPQGQQRELEYSAHDWRAATSVQRAPVTWREWGLWCTVYRFSHQSKHICHSIHCPGALLVSILNKTWRTRNAVRSSNGDWEKTTQHFAMMSASDLFVGCMRSSMASKFFLFMLRLAEKRAKRFRNVTRNFACLLLVSRTSQENVLLVIQRLWRVRAPRTSGLGCVFFITLLSPKLCHKNMLCLHRMVNNVLMFVE